MLEEDVVGKIKTHGNNLMERLTKADCLVTLEKTRFSRNERVEISIIYGKLLKEKGIEIKDSTESRLKQKEAYLEAVERYIQAKNGKILSQYLN